ncbi:MAG: MFS transporter [Chloroflexota bacterium]
MRRPSFFYGWVILGVALLVMAVGYAMRNTFSVFYPVLVEEFAWERGSTALMFSINIVVYGMAAPMAGALVDRFDPRLVLSAAACMMGGAIALCSQATEQWQFYLLYGVVMAVGLSMAGVTPLNAILAKWFVRKRGLVFGILNLGFGISLLVAPAAQSLISGFGRQRAYLTIGLLAIAILVPIVVMLMRRNPADKGLFPDGASGPPPPRATTSAQASAAHSRWARTEWTLSRALRTYQFWLLFVADFCLMGVAQQVVIAHEVYFLRDVGFEPMVAATIYSLFGICMLGGYLCGTLSDRVGREILFIPGCLVSAGGASLFFLITDASHLWLGLLASGTCGFGLGVAVTPFFATIADLFHGKHFGAIMGMITFGFSLGGAFSPWLAGYLHDLTGSYTGAFMVLVGALVLDALLMWLVSPRKLMPIPAKR